MNFTESFLSDISNADMNLIMANGIRSRYQKDELVFAQGEQGDTFYLIEQGSVNVFHIENDKRVDLCRLVEGEYFGEMALVNKDLRSASVAATEDAVLLSIDRDRFVTLLAEHPALNERVNRILSLRSEELILREQLIDTTGIQASKLYVSIKGDPSLRETALFRERYESPADKILDQLQGVLQQLMVERCVYSLIINFNSGEIYTRSVFDPYREEVHTGERLINLAYLDRHFHKIAYEEKLSLIRSMYQSIAIQPQFKTLPDQWKSIYQKSSVRWQPISKQDIVRIMSKLADLRRVPNFYLRNFALSITQDAIRMQFNCDGTHIVNSGDYKDFLDKNFEM